MQLSLTLPKISKLELKMRFLTKINITVSRHYMYVGMVQRSTVEMVIRKVPTHRLFWRLGVSF